MCYLDAIQQQLLLNSFICKTGIVDVGYLL